uniref:Uncharacterized protein n=1 Tax=Crocodylus porosus TaxID=8502 RepID=A0A7M4G1G3_CROPO
MSSTGCCGQSQAEPHGGTGSGAREWGTRPAPSCRFTEPVVPSATWLRCPSPHHTDQAWPASGEGSSCCSWGWGGCRPAPEQDTSLRRAPTQQQEVRTSGALRNDLLTPDVRFTTISCRGFTTGIPAGGGWASVPHGAHPEPSPVLGCVTLCSPCTLPALTCRHQLGLVLLVAHLLLLHSAAREEEAHHPVEELVGELDGQRHHVHLREEQQVSIQHRDPRPHVTPTLPCSWEASAPSAPVTPAALAKHQRRRTRSPQNAP